MNQELFSSDSSPRFRKKFLRTCYIGYPLMGLLGLILMHSVNHNIPTSFTWFPAKLNWMRLGFIVVSAAGLLITLSKIIDLWSSAMDNLREMIAAMLGKMSVGLAFVLAILSGFGEEILFRGGLQPVLGLGITSILFGLVHIGPEGRISAWTIWCIFAGFLLGWLYQSLGTLWPSILVHFLVNFISFVTLKPSHPQVKNDNVVS